MQSRLWVLTQDLVSQRAQARSGVQPARGLGPGLRASRVLLAPVLRPWPDVSWGGRRPDTSQALGALVDMVWMLLVVSGGLNLAVLWGRLSQGLMGARMRLASPVLVPTLGALRGLGVVQAVRGLCMVFL